MFTEASFTIAKTQRQLCAPPSEDWVKKRGAHVQWTTTQPKARNEISPSEIARTDLEGVMLSKINQAEKDKYLMILLLCGT